MRTIQKHSSTSFWFRLIVVFSFFYYVPFRLFCPCPSPASLFPVVDCCVGFHPLHSNAPRQTALKLTPEFIRERHHGVRRRSGGRRVGFRRIGRTEGGIGAVRRQPAIVMLSSARWWLDLWLAVAWLQCRRRRGRRIGWVGSVSSSIVGSIIVGHSLSVSLLCTRCGRLARHITRQVPYSRTKPLVVAFWRAYVIQTFRRIFLFK